MLVHKNCPFASLLAEYVASLPLFAPVFVCCNRPAPGAAAGGRALAQLPVPDLLVGLLAARPAALCDSHNRSPAALLGRRGPAADGWALPGRARPQDGRPHPVPGGASRQPRRAALALDSRCMLDLCSAQRLTWGLWAAPMPAALHRLCVLPFVATCVHQCVHSLCSSAHPALAAALQIIPILRDGMASPEATTRQVSTAGRTQQAERGQQSPALAPPLLPRPCAAGACPACPLRPPEASSDRIQTLCRLRPRRLTASKPSAGCAPRG